MLPLVLVLSMLSGQARDAGTPWPFVGTSPVMRYGPPTSSGVLARYLTPSGSTVSTSGVTFTRSSAGAACTAADGSVTFPATGVPCLAGGYHARPSIANLLVQTDAFDNAAWSAGASAPTSVTITGGYAAAPDGTMTADRIHAATDATHALSYSVRQVVTLTAGSVYSYSFYGLNNSASTTDANYRVFCNTTTSDIVASTSYLSSLSTSAWARVSVSFTVPAVCTGSNNVYVYVGSNGGTNGITDVSAWGAQVVPGSLPLDYCPSGSTPATCAAEVATVPTPSGMSRTEGCAKVCFAPSFTGANPTAAVLALLSANTGGTARLASVTASAQSVAATDGTHAATRTTTLTAGTRACYVTKWSASAGTISVTDVTAGTTTSASSFTTLGALGTTLSIGAENSLSQPLGAVLDSVVLGSSPTACQ